MWSTKSLCVCGWVGVGVCVCVGVRVWCSHQDVSELLRISRSHWYVAVGYGDKSLSHWTIWRCFKSSFATWPVASKVNKLSNHSKPQVTCVLMSRSGSEAYSPFAYNRLLKMNPNLGKPVLFPKHVSLSITRDIFWHASLWWNLLITAPNRAWDTES